MSKLSESIDIQANMLANLEIDWQSYIDLKSEYLMYDPKELILTCFNHQIMRDKDVESLLVSLPELWKDFNLSDWKHIIENIERKKDYRLLFDFQPCFEDIKFLYKYLEIDSIKMYKEDTNINDGNKATLNKIIPGICTDFFKDDLDKESFEDGTYGKLWYFTEMKKRLISQGASSAPFINDAITETEQLISYILGASHHSSSSPDLPCTHIFLSL